MSTYAALSSGAKEPDAPLDIDLYCFSCRRFQMADDHDPLFLSCALNCQHYSLFLAGWKEGLAQAQQVFEQMDLELIEELGRAAGFTRSSSPRTYRGITAERGGADAKLQGEALKRFITSWRQTGGDRRRIEGV